MDIVVTIIRPPAIHIVAPPAPGLTNSRIIMLDPSAIGRKVSSSDRLPVGSSGITGGSCSDNSPIGISGGSRRAGRRNKVVLISRVPPLLECPPGRRHAPAARALTGFAGTATPRIRARGGDPSAERQWSNPRARSYLGRE